MNTENETCEEIDPSAFVKIELGLKSKVVTAMNNGARDIQTVYIKTENEESICEIDSRKNIHNNVKRKKNENRDILTGDTGDIKKEFSCNDFNTHFIIKKEDEHSDVDRHHDDGFDSSDTTSAFFHQTFKNKKYIINSQTKRYECQLCEKTFASPSGLTRHMKSHTGEKPFHCSYCPKAFVNRQYLHQHIRTHTGEKPYKCEHCEKAFSLRETLYKHRRTHTGERPYQCDQCGKCYSERGNLVVHKRVHTGEKPFQCDQCQRAYSDSYKLVKHKRLHSRIKPFVCDECDERFLRKVHLVTHKRSH